MSADAGCRSSRPQQPWSCLACAALPAACSPASSPTACCDRRSGSLSLARTLPIHVGTSLMLVGFAACTLADSNRLVVGLLSLALFGKGFATLGWTLGCRTLPGPHGGCCGRLVQHRVECLAHHHRSGHRLAGGGNRWLQRGAVVDGRERGACVCQLRLARSQGRTDAGRQRKPRLPALTAALRRGALVTGSSKGLRRVSAAAAYLQLKLLATLMSPVPL